MAETAKAITTLELGPGSGFQIPVSLKKAGSKSDVSLDTASQDGNPMRQIEIDIVTGATVETREKRKGIFRVKAVKTKKETWSDFVEISESDLDAIKAATDIEAFTIDHFVPLKDVPFERVTGAYFLAPVEGMSARPLAMLAKALKKSKRAGVFKLVKTSRQYLAVVYEQDGGLIVNTIAYAGDFAAVSEAAAALDAKVASAEVDLAVQLIEAYSSPVEVIDEYEDDLVSMRADLIDRALRGQPVPKAKDKEPLHVVGDGLESALEASLRKASSGKARAAA